MAAPALAGPADEAPLATPAGITIQLVGRFPFSVVTGYSLQRQAGQELAYGDAAGRTLYVYAKDQPGRSLCAGDCAAAFPPALAAPGATPESGWSLVEREDGARQWAWQGHPLYTSAKDQKVGETAGKGEEGGAWRVAAFQPAAGMALPPGIGVQELGDAHGQVLVNAQGMTLYQFDGQPAEERDACGRQGCGGRWVPEPAPEMALPVGDFTVLVRPDASRQWAFRGHPLYRFAGDLEAGLAHGIGAAPRWRPALVVRYFMPPGVTVQTSLGQGTVLADAAGLTLYRRDAYTYQLGGHGLRRGVPPRPHVGRDIGISGCDGECLKSWHPFAAPADAAPSGYWQVLTRTDGSRQWAYKGYALYRFAGDSRPGDLHGIDEYDYAISEDPAKAAAPPSRMAAAGALFWTYAFP
jgi:predicted lipoprotein with Yx(FWY)xxD motif